MLGERNKESRKNVYSPLLSFSSSCLLKGSTYSSYSMPAESQLTSPISIPSTPTTCLYFPLLIFTYFTANAHRLRITACVHIYIKYYLFVFLLHFSFHSLSLSLPPSDFLTPLVVIACAMYLHKGTGILVK